MTDYRSLDQLDVFCGDECVATLARRTNGCEFAYTTEFSKTSRLPIALNLPVTPEPLVTEGLLNLPPFFAGLLPEGVMFAAAQRLIGSARDDLFAVLAATGGDAIGDVSVRVPRSEAPEPSVLSLKAAKEAIRGILEGSDKRLNAITAISGVAPKLSLGGLVRSSRSSRYIAKFADPMFPRMAENEAACMALARRCGLDAPRAWVEDGVYIVERFDRVASRSTFAKLHVEDMLQVLNLFPNRKYSLDFVEIGEALAGIGISPAGMMHIIRLYAFSYIVGNGDLHAKNVSLIRRPDGRWTPSPAYDIVSTLPYRHLLGGGDAMALALADESLGRFTVQEFIDYGERFGVRAEATRKAIHRLARSAHDLAKELLENSLPSEVVDVVLERALSLCDG